MASATSHEPAGRRQTKKATASGWIGSPLEYYDPFIYATAASLIFPQIFFPKTDPKIGIIASLATFGAPTAASRCRPCASRPTRGSKTVRGGHRSKSASLAWCATTR